MSRNLCSTQCHECGFWDFTPEDVKGELFDIEPYLREIGSRYASTNNSGYGWGHGYRQPEDYHSWKASGNGHTINGSGRCEYADREGWTVEAVWVRYRKPAEEDWYRWGRVQCPICRTHYLLYLRQFPGVAEPESRRTEMEWEAYDMSYYHAFNDEPADADIAERIEWTREKLVEACREYVERRAQR